jgi:hypothetical protein
MLIVESMLGHSSVPEIRLKIATHSWCQLVPETAVLGNQIIDLQLEATT